MASPSLPPQADRVAGSLSGLFRIACIATMSLAIVGCIPRSGPPRQPPPIEPQQQEVEPEEVVQPSRLPADESRNRVAVLVPLSGENAALGQSILNAANLALLDTGGERVRITAYDTAAGGAAAANEAIADGNGLFLGPLLAEDVRSAAPIARRADVPVIAFSNDTSVAGDGVYIMGFDPSQAIDRVVNFARSRGAQRFGALVPTGTYGQRAGRGMIASVEGAGGRLIGMQTFERSQASIRAASTRLNGQGQYDAVLIADGSRMALLAAPIVRQSSPQPRILGTELWATEANLGAQPGLRGAWFAAPSEGLFSQFRTRYRSRYNANPYRLASLGYDAVLLAVRVAADWPIGRTFPARALRDPTGFAGVDGAFRFNDEGVAQRSLEVREVTPTGTNIVSPAPRDFN